MGPIIPPIIALLCESFFCGALNILFGVSVYVVLFRKPRTRTTYVLLAVNIVLYATSVLHWIVTSTIILSHNQATYSSMGRAQMLIIVWSPAVNYILGDTIVIWRAWLISERNTKICIPSFLCLVGTLVSYLISVIYNLEKRSAFLNLLTWGFLLGSNLWTTAIIAWRAWRHRRFIKSQLGAGTARTNTEKILGLLIESGAIYCFILSLGFVIFNSLTTAAPISSVILDVIFIQLVAIYPLTIIIIVHIRATSSNSQTQISSLNFVTPPDVPSETADPDRHSFTSG